MSKKKRRDERGHLWEQGRCSGCTRQGDVVSFFRQRDDAESAQLCRSCWVDPKKRAGT